MRNTLHLVRVALERIAADRPWLQFRDGKVNQAALARALGVGPATVSRIFTGKRNLGKRSTRFQGASQPYQPSPALLNGIGRLIGAKNQSETWAFILQPNLRLVRKTKPTAR